MKSVKQIKEEIGKADNNSYHDQANTDYNRIAVELLLDIRELLKDCQ